ncbi:CaiB/BaiF CoA transferase family protein [Streptomyces sp. NPDC057253]|uniref:CaiB/BaiF CoA transferase family protein n=1 Tax=Streptomyces sp. NPDC057253 TaxID=3346069 RepID=UPI0036255F29
MNALALDHIRVADLGIITAGAATTQALADFGADVIKVESTTYADPFRQWTQVAAKGNGPADLNSSPPFQTVNRNKRGVGIDLKNSRGREAFLRLVSVSDVVVENFRRGVMERLGLGFEELRAVKPDIVLVSLTSQGLTGPESGYISFGSTLDALGGLMSVTGYDADTPRWSGTNVNYPDQLVSFLAPGVILAALRQRDLTGEAIHVDFSQRESVTALIGESVLDYTDTGEIARPHGNRDAVAAPQGVYPCQGEEQWIALSVAGDEQWAALCRVLDLPALATDEQLATASGRRAAHDLLDKQIAAATVGHDKRELAARLQEAGVAASPVLDAGEVLDSPQLAALGFLQDAAPGGFPAHRQRGFVAELGDTPGTVRQPAPRLGEHTRDVLSALLGYSDEEIADLAEAGAITFDDH